MEDDQGVKSANNERDLDALLAGRKAAVLFHTTWCPFCVTFRPVFNEVMKTARGWATIDVTIDDEDNPLWEKYSIEVVPTVIFFDDGKIILRLDAPLGVGLRETDLRKALRSPEVRRRGERTPAVRRAKATR